MVFAVTLPVPLVAEISNLWYAVLFIEIYGLINLCSCLPCLFLIFFENRVILFEYLLLYLGSWRKGEESWTDVGEEEEEEQN